VGALNWFFDTSVLVAASVARHPHNAPSLSVLEELVTRRHHGYISAHTLTELYAVLTRTPFKPAIYPNEAWQIIEQMVLPHLELVTLTPRECREVIRDCAMAGWTGGKVYDAIHLRCAQKSRFDRLYTFNGKDFRALAPDDIRNRIVTP
jgi:predicted nucleic acid-binding protein